MRRRKRKYTKIAGARAVAMMARVRSRNNRNWMALLTLAIKARPREARKIIARIQAADLEIGKWLSRV